MSPSNAAGHAAGCMADPVTHVLADYPGPHPCRTAAMAQESGMTLGNQEPYRGDGWEFYPEDHIELTWPEVRALRDLLNRLTIPTEEP
jgi:hypothetical protein